MNATALCESIPSNWMYLGECCRSSGDLTSIARWFGEICTDWNASFALFDYMARDDWLDYVLAWNWTVRADNSSGRVPSDTCQSPQRYLGLFALESFILLLANGVFLGCRYWYYDSHLRNWVKSIRMKTRHRLSWVMKSFKWVVKDNTQTKTKSARSWGPPIVWGFLWAVGNVAMSFANAYAVKLVPGFQDVPAMELALLWCSRPNLSWITCVIGMIGLWNKYSNSGEETRMSGPASSEEVINDYSQPPGRSGDTCEKERKQRREQWEIRLLADTAYSAGYDVAVLFSRTN
jgi:hypothetical protein